MYKKFALFLIISAALWSCDNIDNPIPENLGNSISLGSGIDYITDPSLNITNDTNALKDLLASNTWDTVSSPDNSTERFIILEEFTGHTCIFCPMGAREIARLDSIYEEQLIPIAIHAGSFARPQPGTHYTTDFRVAGGYGEDYLTQFNPGNAYPRGMVSRLGGTSKSSNDWANDINSIKDDQPLASLIITNYLANNKSLLRVNIEIEWLQTLSEEYSLQVDLIEDHIIDWQKDGSKVIELYDHRHVLRKVVNGTYGKPLLEDAKKGDKVVIEYIFPFDDSWVKENLESIAFIFNSDPNSYEIIQGNAAHIK